MLEKFKQLTHDYNWETGDLEGGILVERHLSQLRGCFADEMAFENKLKEGDPLVYKVIAIEPARGSGDLHYGLGVLYPGKVGNEYFLTKGHLHSSREAAEVYVGLKGEGMMLLEDEQTGESRLELLGEGKIVYVPGYTAHRTMNVGKDALTYLGIYPANAGHDYGAISKRNFLKILLEQSGKPVLFDRTYK